MTGYIADKSARSVRVYTTDNRPTLVQTIRLADQGSVDQTLAAHGWLRTTPWARSDTMAPDHAMAAVERTGEPLPDEKGIY